MTTRKQTTEDMKAWLIQDGRGIEIVGDYVNMRTKTLFRCPLGHTWSARPHSIKIGKGCAVCNRRTKLTEAEFVEWLAHDGRGIKLISGYDNEKALFECADGHRWMNQPGSVKNTIISCPECRLSSMRRTAAAVQQELDEDGRGFKIIGPYEARHKKTTFECAKGHRWKMTPAHARHGGRCQECFPSSGGFDLESPAWFYIFVRAGYLKYGITKRLTLRMKAHQKNGQLDLAFIKHYQDGTEAFKMERRIKQTYGGRYATKEQCQDGWTETLPVSLLSEIIKGAKQ